MKTNISVSKYWPLIAVLATVPALAAKEVGNGGTAVVCRGADGLIESAELLDLFEGRNLLKLDIPELDVPVEMQVDQAGVKLLEVGGNALYEQFRKEVKAIRANWSALDGDVQLEPTQDVLPVISQKGCRIEQLANYRPDGKVLVDSEILAALSSTQQAGLYVHEAVYKLLRMMADAQDSVEAREITARLFASSDEIDALKRTQLVTPRQRFASIYFKSSVALTSVKSEFGHFYDNAGGAIVPIALENIAGLKEWTRTTKLTCDEVYNRGFYFGYKAEAAMTWEVQVVCDGRILLKYSGDGPASSGVYGRTLRKE